MNVLGIETSCDETGVALYHTGRGLLAYALHSQSALHERHGGVVPELASRDHIRRVVPLIERVLAEADVAGRDVDGVAYTAGPGLIGALLVGVSVGRSLAYAWGVPAVAVHHMEGHLLVPMLEDKPPPMPFVALLVSGGHTLLVKVTAFGRYELLGESLDDAVGEAFDKTAKLLGLGYPGGAALSALAESGHAERWRFPRPMTDRPGLDFSFSGLKTHVVNTFNALDADDKSHADIAAAFVEAAVDTLAIKCQRALRQTRITTLVAAGGVSANRQLRTKLAAMCDKEGASVFFPRPEFCTDNGAMIAYAGALHLQAGASEPLAFAGLPRWPLGG